MRESTRERRPCAGEPLVVLREVGKVYRSGTETLEALRGVSATFCRGEFIGVVGKSGAGKSTLLNMITGLDRPTSGEVIVGGTAVHALGENALALWRGRNVGVVYQSFELLPTLTLLGNVCLPMDLCGLYHPVESPRRAMALLEQVGIAEHAHKHPGEISGGQQQRVAIARALANDPPLVVADEPTGNLDSATAETILELFAGLVAQGRTVIMVTHDETLGARFHRALALEDGVLCEGAPGA